MDIDKLRIEEDLAIIEHLKEISNIVQNKCKRCKTVYGCMGCVFSHGDGIIGYVRQSVKMMMKQRPELSEKLKIQFCDILRLN